MRKRVYELCEKRKKKRGTRLFGIAIFQPKVVSKE